MNPILTALLENKYAKSLIILFLVVAISRIFVFIIHKIIIKVAAKTANKFDDIIIKKTKTSVFWLLILFGFRIALTPLGIENGFMHIANSLINSLIIMDLAYILAVTIDTVINTWGSEWAKKTESSIDDDLLPLFRKVSHVVIIILTIMLVLDQFNINITGLVAGVGIAGIVLGFALKDSLANIFGGISLILDRTFKVNDVIKLESGDMGVVKDIGLRSTKVQTWDNELLTIPNGQLANSKIQNFVQPDRSVRIVIDFSVAYGSDHKQVKKIVKSEILNLKNIVKTGTKSPRVLFLEMGDFALKFKAFFWVNDYSEKFATKEKAVCMIYDILNKHKISIPFPTHTVYLKE